MIMKRVIATVTAVGLILGLSFAASAQGKGGQNFKERMLSEKIAFITTELSLTPAEAQVFWPVYNQIQEANKASFEAMKKAYHALHKAIKEGKSEKEISDALDAYLAASEAAQVDQKAIADQYKTVLPVEKVAKLFVAEEKFRKMQINKLREPRQPQGEGFKGGRPEGRPEGRPGGRPEGRPEMGPGHPKGNGEGVPANDTDAHGRTRKPKKN